MSLLNMFTRVRHVRNYHDNSMLPTNYSKAKTVLKRAASSNNRKRIEVSNLETGLRYIGTANTPSIYISNCWGTTLFTLGELDDLRFVDDGEIEEYLNLKTREVSRPAFGDVLAVWNSGGCIEHTAIYVGDGLYWHQAGFGGTFMLSSRRDVMRMYPGTSQVRRVIK